MNKDRLLRALIELAPRNFFIHLILVITSLSLSIVLGVFLGIFLTRFCQKKTINLFLQFLNVMQTIPAFAFIAIGIPILGFGYKPTIVVLVFQGILPIVKGTILGFLEVDPDVRDAGKGLGMSSLELLIELDLPLAFPYIMNGVKIASTYIVSVATLAGFVGAGGLGILISGGLAMLYPEYLIIGASLCALIALALNYLLNILEKSINYKIFGEKF